MPAFITDDQFDALFRDFRHTAWRWEAQAVYDSDRQSPAYQLFLRGEEPVRDPRRPWLQNIATQVKEGKRIERVRVLDDPPTEGQRFLLTGAPYNIAAGEDIRHLDRAKAEELGLPGHDFWLFDSRILLRMHFDEAARWLGAEIVQDPLEILAACQTRDAAWHYAIPHSQYRELGTVAM
ncbi:hypothetical protein EDD99_0029 [Streptomyces sp. 846.5]|nr:DUF6879 family protein [Streptomyces sp. 846.5]TDU01667.1 hypothetical protein EDD99_0029 [Streptomyces sp. 846.5]